MCRWGGEEFIILSTDKNVGTNILEMLRKKISDEKYKYEKDSLRITVTIGVTGYDSASTN